jgi:hypothetical protein
MSYTGGTPSLLSGGTMLIQVDSCLGSAHSTQSFSGRCPHWSASQMDRRLCYSHASCFLQLVIYSWGATHAYCCG